MKKAFIIILLLFGLSLSVNAQNNQPQTQITLQEIKDIVALPADSQIKKSFNGLIDCWYAIEIKAGKTEEEALLITLDKLREKLDEFTK